MKSFTTLSSYYTDKSQNTTAANATRGKELINDRHRYLIQKYFDNLQTSYVQTVGSNALTFTGTLASGATSATLNSAWTYPTGYQLVSFSNTNTRSVLFTNGSASVSWQVGLSASATASATATGIQGYSIPQNISKLKDVTVTVGQLKFTPKPILTQVDWDAVNFLPYNSDIPQYYYVYNGLLNIFPIPSTTGNVITYNYKLRVADMTYADYATGTVAATVGSTSVTGTGTTWNSVGTFPLNVDLTYANIFLKIDPPKGDGQYYQVRTFTSDTALTLVNPIVNAPVTSGATYTLGQYPLLSEDFHDMLPQYALMVYYSSIKKDEDQFKLFSSLYKDNLELLADYAGTRQVNVDLGTQPNPVNPNLFIYAQS